MDNGIVLTFDVDWAPDFIVDEIASTLISNNVKSTWFVTHNSPAIQRLRNKQDFFEIGIHPNLYPDSTQGSTIDEVMEYVKNIAPESISMRTHGLYQSTKFLAKASQDYGIKIDASLFLPHISGLQPYWFYWANSIKVLRIPTFWEDDYEFYTPNACWEINNLNYKIHGFKVFSFHPIHIALNSYSVESYNELKIKTPISNCTPADIKMRKNHGEGTETLFLQVVNLLSRKGNFIKELIPSL